MEEKFIELRFTQHQVDVIFECLIGSCSCTPDCSDLVNYVRSFVSYFKSGSKNCQYSILDDCLNCILYNDCSSWK